MIHVPLVLYRLLWDYLDKKDLNMSKIQTQNVLRTVLLIVSFQKKQKTLTLCCIETTPLSQPNIVEDSLTKDYKVNKEQLTTFFKDSGRSANAVNI